MTTTTTEYEENFADALAGEGARMDHNGDAVILASGAAIAWRCPGTPDDVETGLAARAIRIASKAAGAIKAIEDDADHTPEWKQREVAKVEVQSHAEFERAREAANVRIAEFDGADHAEAAPPPLAPSDAVSASIDREIRDHVRGLDADGVNALAQAAIDGKLDIRTLHALLRSPLPLPDALARVLPAAAADMAAKSDPTTFRQRRQAAERVNWLRQVVEQASYALPRISLPRSERAA